MKSRIQFSIGSGFKEILSEDLDWEVWCEMWKPTQITVRSSVKAHVVASFHEDK